MILIDNKFISKLFDKALVNSCLREAYDLRNSKDDGNHWFQFIVIRTQLRT